jgi:hypothetical protein
LRVSKDDTKKWSTIDGFYGWELWLLIHQKLKTIMVTSAMISISKVYAKEIIVCIDMYCMFEMQFSSSCN